MNLTNKYTKHILHLYKWPVKNHWLTIMLLVVFPGNIFSFFDDILRGVMLITCWYIWSIHLKERILNKVPLIWKRGLRGVKFLLVKLRIESSSPNLWKIVSSNLVDLNKFSSMLLLVPDIVTVNKWCHKNYLYKNIILLTCIYNNPRRWFLTH